MRLECLFFIGAVCTGPGAHTSPCWQARVAQLVEHCTYVVTPRRKHYVICKGLEFDSRHGHLFYATCPRSVTGCHFVTARLVLVNGCLVKTKVFEARKTQRYPHFWQTRKLLMRVKATTRKQSQTTH